MKLLGCLVTLSVFSLSLGLPVSVNLSGNHRVQLNNKQNSKKQALEDALQISTHLLDKTGGERIAQESERRSFNSWGGKRTAHRQANEKRAFNSWGGKRNDEDVAKFNEKRAFNSWGGKRSQEDGKRTFNSWGGKRSQEDGKRTFNSWGGKRGQEEEKRTFNSWGGKRTQEGGKRTFNSWGGKRGQEEEKRAFNSWGGKRTQEDGKRTFNSWGGKRDQEEEKRSFNSWGGKRSQEERAPSANEEHALKITGEEQSLETTREASDVNNGKRSFNSWGGKRNEVEVEKSKGLPESEAGERTDDKGPRDTLKRSTRAASPGSGFWFSWGANKKARRPTPVRRKPVFNAWGGKRSTSSGWWTRNKATSDASDEDEDQELQYPLKEAEEEGDPRLAQALARAERLLEKAYSSNRIQEEANI